MPVTTEFKPEGVSETLDAIRSVWQAYREGIPISRELFETYKQQKSEVYEMRKAYMTLKTELRMQYVETQEFFRILTKVGTIGRELLQMWQAYTIAQIRVERLTRDVSDAQKEVAKWQDLVNQYLKDFGEDSAYYLDAVDNLKKSQNELTEAQKRLTQAQQENILGYASMGLSIIGVIGQFATLKQQIDMARIVMSGGTLSAIGLGSAIKGIGISLIGMSPYIAVATVSALALYSHWNELTEYWNTEVMTSINDLMKSLGSLGTTLFGTGNAIDVLRICSQKLADDIKFLMGGLSGFLEVLSLIITAMNTLIKTTPTITTTTLPPNPYIEKGGWISPAQSFPQMSMQMGGGPSQMRGYEIGGVIPFTGPYYMHAGEVWGRGQSAGIREVTINMYNPNMTNASEARDRGYEAFKAFMQRLEGKA